MSFYGVGEEESLYGFYSVNSMMEQIDASLVLPAHASNLFGSIDLGGESFEIAFFNTLRKKVHAVSYSFMGANQMKQRVNSYLTRELKASTVQNPCYFKGS